MGRLIVQETISADGFAADPEGRTSFMEPFIGGTAEGFARRQLELIEGLSGMLMGARTYEGFSSFWPTEAAAQELIAPAFNSLHRYVFSHSHSEAPWGDMGDCEVFSGDTREAIRRIKAESEGDIGCWGSLSLVRELLDLGEVEELRLVVAPSMIAQGRRFGSGEPVKLTLRESTTYDDALVEMVYDVRGD
ncbi:dihydrofolate reductase family protein [Sinomonas susongensis]|uniref:dihydrofolate reductase family protein n=1 Tax=Sinomonas susongensis TaxID=1324851 RepID=UPI001108F9DF|nr:dihydrofolate reductase family protein [Sinomonas susongensis]